MVQRTRYSPVTAQLTSGEYIELPYVQPDDIAEIRQQLATPDAPAP